MSNDPTVEELQKELKKANKRIAKKEDIIEELAEKVAQLEKELSDLKLNGSPVKNPEKGAIYVKQETKKTRMCGRPTAKGTPCKKDDKPDLDGCIHHRGKPRMEIIGEDEKNILLQANTQ